MKLCIFSSPLGRDQCPSDLDKAQEATGAKGLTVTPFSPPSLVLEHRQMAKDCAAPTKLLPLLLGTTIYVAQADIGETCILLS